jgi:hypothetical protein
MCVVSLSDRMCVVAEWWSSEWESIERLPETESGEETEPRLDFCLAWVRM